MDIVLDDLLCGGLMIYRDRDGFSYNQDSVLLANAVKARPSDRVLDMCAGGGIVSILGAYKTGAHFTAAELQQAQCALIERSVAHNAQENSVSVVNCDIRALNTLLPMESFDAAACNPPYYPGGTKSGEEGKRLAVHQDECSVFDVALCAKRMLKNSGKLFLTYPASRLSEACRALGEAGVEPKRLTPVCSKKDSTPYLFLFECKKGGKVGLVLEPPVILEETE